MLTDSFSVAFAAKRQQNFPQAAPSEGRLQTREEHHPDHRHGLLLREYDDVMQVGMATVACALRSKSRDVIFVVLMRLWVHVQECSWNIH